MFHPLLETIDGNLQGPRQANDFLQDFCSSPPPGPFFATSSARCGRDGRGVYSSVVQTIINHPPNNQKWVVKTIPKQVVYGIVLTNDISRCGVPDHKAQR